MPTKALELTRTERMAALAEKYPDPPTGRPELRRQWREWKREEEAHGGIETWFRAFPAS